MKKAVIIILSLFMIALDAGASLYRSYQTQDGLSHNSVWAVMQDSRGFMWFGTNDGLNRFDGLRFEVYRRNDSRTPGLGNNFINCLLEAADGSILAGTKEGLYRYLPDEGRFCHVCLDGKGYGQDKNSVHQLLYDKEGRLWVGCYGQGIFCLDPDMNVLRHYTEPVLPSRFITAMQFDLSGNIWVGTDNAGLYCLNTNTGTAKTASIGKANIQTLYRQNNNTFWVGTTSSGLFHYDPRSDQYTEVKLGGSTVYDVKAITPYGPELIMASENGLLTLDVNTGVLRQYDDTKSYDNMPDKSIFAIAVDSEGALWLGTYFYGVCYRSPRVNSFSFYTLDDKSIRSSTNIIKQFSQTSGGEIVLTSRNNGVSLYDPTARMVRDLPVQGLSDNIQFALQVGDRLWVSDYDRGIVVASYPQGAALKTYTTAHGLPSNVVNNICHTSQGHIYVGTARGAARFDNDRFEVLPELKNASVMTIIEDYEGNLWFATHFHGIFKKTPEGSYTNYVNRYGDDSSLPGNNINNIFQDSHGMIWVGLEGEGLALLNPADGRVVKRFTENTGLPSDIIYATREDAKGNMWVATGGGLVKISASDYAIQDFRYIENLLNIHYTHNSSARSSVDNHLYFGGSGGFVTFDPSEIEAGGIAPVVRIVGFTVGGERRVLPRGRLDLESNEATFSFDVACLSYLSPEQNTIAYRLEGFDSEWKTLETGRHIEYMNLPWGDYKFVLKGSNNDGVWSEPLELKVHVNRPLLLSNSMLIVYALLLISCIWLAKRRIEYLQRRKMVKFSHAKEKELYEAKIGFFTNIAHEIRTPLSLISAPLETILASGDGTPRTRHNLEVMRSNVHRLLELINQLLDFRKAEAQLMVLNFRECNVSEIVSAICARYEVFAHLNMIKIDASGIVPDIRCTLDTEAFEKIVGNLMSNATKYAGRNIRVAMWVDEASHTLRLEIADDGPGIKEKDMERIFESFYRVDDHGKHPGTGLGLPLARRLAEMHGGTIAVESEYGHGSKFTVSIPATLQAGEFEGAPRKADEPDAAAPVSADIAPTETDDRAATVLLVEDNVQLRAFIAEQLSDTYRVLEAANGIEAMKVLESRTCDIIVSDIMMPDMDGIELCRAVRSNAAFSNLPVVMLSAKTDVETKVEGLTIGADAYIEKPFSIEQLRAQLKSILDSRRRLHESFIKSPLDFYKQKQTDDLHETDNSEFVQRLNELIVENFTNPEFNIDALARSFCMSRSTFHGKVKSVTGETPNNYIRIIRLCKGAEFLASGKYQIVEVCYMVGFNTPSYFSKCFAEHFGKLPKDYISELNNK